MSGKSSPEFQWTDDGDTLFENDTFLVFVVNSTYFVFKNCKVSSFLKWHFLVFKKETFLYLKVPHFLI